MRSRAGGLVAALRGRWTAAAIAGALAAVTRPNGVLLLAPLVLLWTRTAPRRLGALAALLLLPAALGAHMLYLAHLTGNPLAFSAIQVRWGRHPGFFLGPLWAYLRRPMPLAEKWNFRALNFTAGVFGLGAAWWWARRARQQTCWSSSGPSWAASAFVLLGTVLPLSTHTMQSLARYTMALAPVPLALVGALPRRDAGALLVAFALLAGAVTALLALDVTFAVT